MIPKSQLAISLSRLRANSKPQPQRCASCAYWQPCPTEVKGCAPEQICGISKRGGYGLHGQDGRAIITPPTFGCIEWVPKESSDTRKS